MDIAIRHAEPADFAAIKRIYEQASGYADTLQLPYPPDALWRQRLEQPGMGHHMLVACVDGEVVGQLGLEVPGSPRRRHTATIGMGVREEYRGRGVGSLLLQEALRLANAWLGVSRVELSVYTDNAAAIALYEKHGFVIEGECRDYALREGRYVNVYLMARLTPRP